MTTRTNLVANNPSFESTTLGWAASGLTAARDTTEHRTGAASLKVTGTTAATSYAYSVTAGGSLIAGHTYTYSFWVKVPTALTGTYYCTIQAFNASSALIQTFSAATTIKAATGGWERRSVTFTAPANSNYALIFAPYSNVAGSTGDVFYVDDVLLEEGSTVNTYFDGDTSGASWTGTPNASPSTLTNTITVVGTTTGISPSTSDTTQAFVTIPSGVQDGDVAYAQIGWSQSGSVGSISMDSGWTQIYSNNFYSNSNLTIFKKTLTSGDSGTAPNVYVSGGGGSFYGTSSVTVLRGAGAESGSGEYSRTATTNSTLVYPSITPTAHNTFQFAFIASNSVTGDALPAEGWDERADVAETTAIRIANHTKQFYGGANTATGDTNTTFSASVRAFVYRLAIAPTISSLPASVSASPMTASATAPNAVPGTGYTAQAMTATAAVPDAIGATTLVAHTETVAVTIDSYTDSSQPTTNYGTNASLGIGSGQTTFIKLPSLAVDSNEQVIRVRLYIASSYFGANYTATLHKVNADWSESNITHNNKPSITSLGETTPITSGIGTWNMFDVTSYVASAPYGFAITSTGGSLRSSDNTPTTSNPYVELLVAEIPDTPVSVSASPSTASAAMPDATVSASHTVSVGSTPMTASATAPNASAYIVNDKTITAVPLNASAELVEPSQGVFDGYAAEVMEATAELLTPTASSETLAYAEHMDAYAELMGGGFAVPLTVNAEVLTASAELESPAIAVQVGVIIRPTPVTASSRLIEPATINGAPIVASEADDKYFQRVLNDGAYYWLRLNDKGSIAKNRIGGGNGGTYHGVQVGQFNGPEGRHSVHFDGDASIEQIEVTGTNVDETLPYENYPVSTLEFSFRTTKKDTFLWAGADYQVKSTFFGASTTPVPPRQMFLKDGKISFASGTNTLNAFSGFRNLADGEWHHVVVRSTDYRNVTTTSNDEGGVDIWIDGKFEIRRWAAGLVVGFPDWIGSRPKFVESYNLGDLPSSQNFVGDMTEFVFYGRYLSDDAIPRHYYDFMGWNPVGADPVEALAFMTAGARGKGNQKRALYLYWSLDVDAYNIGGGGFSGKPNYDVLAGNWWHRNTGVRDFEGYKMFTRRVLSGLDGQAYRDPATDYETLINLETDVDIDEYDMIIFADWPDESADFDRYRDAVHDFNRDYDRLLSQLRWANDRGIGLMVTVPRLAVDLGIIDRVEWTSTLRESKFVGIQGNAYGLYDYASAVKYPWNISSSANLLQSGNRGATGTGVAMKTDPAYLASKALFYGDTNKNDRFRVRAIIEGLTDIPSYMVKDAIFHMDFDLFGWSIKAYKYLHAMNGLQIGDEFIFHGTDMGYPQNQADTGAFFDMEVGRWRGAYAVPPGHVKAGTIVTTFGAKHWLDDQEVDNPYRDFATTIVLRPGDVLAGRPVGGRIFVNFTEAPSLADGSVPVQILPGSIDDDGTAKWPSGYNPETPAQREWEFSATRIGMSSSSSNSTTTVTILLPDGSTQSYESYNAGSGLAAIGLTEGHPLFNMKYYPRLNMIQRGMRWVSRGPDLGEGDKAVGSVAMTAEATMPSPTVKADRDVTVGAAAVNALAEMPKVAEDQTGDVEIHTLPATAQATFTGYGKTIHAAPMEASATLVENFDMVHATGDYVVLTLHGVDATLYLKEEA